MSCHPSGFRPDGRHFGQEVADALEAKAQQMTREGIEKMGLCEEDLAKPPKGDNREAMLTAELRANTTMTKEWIARRLRMGTRWDLIGYWKEYRRKYDNPSA